jgi:hypothetical protein
MKSILSFNLKKEVLKKDKEKQTFQINFKELSGLPKSAEKPLFVGYKPTKTKTIETIRLDAVNGVVTWNHDFVFKLSLYKEPKGNFKKKNMTFIIYEVNVENLFIFSKLFLELKHSLKQKHKLER